MSKAIVALDCMGGDDAPGEIVKGAVLAANENKNINIKLVGRKEDIEKEYPSYEIVLLKNLPYENNYYSIIFLSNI